MDEPSVNKGMPRVGASVSAMDRVNKKPPEAKLEPQTEDKIDVEQAQHP